MNIKELIQLTIEREASDLHIVSNYYPVLRVNGALFSLTFLDVITKEESEKLFLPLLSEEQKTALFANKEIDFGYEVDGTRVRANLYFAKGALAASFRIIPSRIKTIEELDLPPSFHQIGDLNSGLVLITGPTGEGKTTTIASIINEINIKSAKHILTIEDPIEFVYGEGKSIISQREINQDSHSWAMSLRSALREDPDVILVGEIRDYESASHVLTLAETGHLVFSTLHTISAAEAINRLIDIFPSDQQNQVVTQLSSVLRTVVSQRLMPRADKKGRIVGVEVLFNNPAVANIIRERKLHLIDNVIQTSEKQGFIYFERYLKSLFDDGKITKETALEYAIRPKEIEKFLSIISY